MAKLNIFKRPQVDMVNGPLLKNIIRFAIPFVLSNLFQTFFNAADLAIVGSFCGSANVAAVGATGVLTRLIIGMFVGLGTGAGVVVAHSIGAKDDESVSKTVHSAITTALIGGVFLTFFGLFTCEYFLGLMKTPPDIIALSALYMKIYFVGIIPMLLYNFGAAILRASGDSQSPLIYLTMAGFINVGLNILFVTVFDMTVDGVAWATTISQCFSAFMVIRTLMKRSDACKLVLNKLRIYKKQFLRILAIGIPSGIQGAMFSISNLTIQTAVNSFTSTAINSGHATGASIESFIYMVGMAMQQTSANFIGQNVGAKNHKRLRKIAFTCLACVLIFYAVAGTFVYIFGEQLLGLYIKDSAEAIEWGMLRFGILCPSMILCAVMDVMGGSLRGLGKATTSMLMSVFGVCGIRLLWVNTVFRMPQYHTMQVLYYSFPISWGITMVLQFTAFMIVTAKMIKKWKAEQQAALPENA